MKAGGGEWNTYWRAPQPTGFPLTDVNHRVVHMIAARRTHLRHLYPFALRKVGGNDLVGVFDVSGGWNSYRLRHSDDVAGGRDVPAIGPVRRRGSITGISFGGTFVGPAAE